MPYCKRENERKNMREALAKLIRQILLLVGAGSTSADWLDESAIDQLAGALAVIIALIWSWLSWWTSRRTEAKSK